MLSLKNITIEDKKGKAILNNLSLEIRTGDFIVVGGQSEKEREMLISLLSLNEEISMGEMYIDGIELSKITPAQKLTLKREEFGFMTEAMVLDECLSVKDNVLMPLVFSGANKEKQNEKVNRALMIVGLADFAKVVVKNLTDWQKNKVLIARAIVNQPKTLIFSEPYRLIEKIKLEEVLGLLKGLNKDGVTIIVNSNLTEYAEVAKRKVVITNGSVIELKKEKQPKEKVAKKPRTKKTTTKTKKEKVAKKEQSQKIEEPTPESEIKNEEVSVQKPKKVKSELKNDETKPAEEPKKEVKKAPAKKSVKQKDNNSEQLTLDLDVKTEDKKSKKPRTKKEVDTNGANNQ